MRENRKKTIRTLLLIFILFLGLGFAALAANLKIDGTVNVSKTAWDVHFENVSITEGSVTANPAPVSDDATTTEMTYTINFTKPGDYFEFTTDIVNEGTIDAMVDVVSNNAYANAASTTPIALPTYLTNTVTYADGVEIVQNQELLHGESEKIKVRVEFKKDIQASDLPSSGDTTIVFKFVGNYKQKDENAVSYNVYNPGDVVYFDPVSENKCDATTYDQSASASGTSTCYKWRTISTNDRKLKDKINIQLDHNLYGDKSWGTSSHAETGPTNSLTLMSAITETWTRVNYLNYSYDTTASVSNYGIFTCTNGTCKITKNGVDTQLATNVKARMITGEEIMDIANKERNDDDPTLHTWNITVNGDKYYFSNPNYIIGTKDSGTGNINLSWLIENTDFYDSNNTSGATKAGSNGYESTWGYWTMTPVSDREYAVWVVENDGSIYYSNVYQAMYGPRPVIEIEKTKLN